MSPKPFFVLIVFILFIAVFAGGAIGDTNLTDGGQSQQLVNGSNTISVSNTPSNASSSSGIDYNIFADDSSSAATAANTPPVTILKNSVAINSLCGSTYTVKAGDTLSKIAQACGVSLQAVLAANPSIQNPNIIKVSQEITIVKAAPSASIPTSVPTSRAKVKPSASPPPEKMPGEPVTFTVRGFQPNVYVQIGIGKVGENAQVTGQKLTDKNGVVNGVVTIPASAVPGEKWVVTVATVKRPKVKLTAIPFNIGN